MDTRSLIIYLSLAGLLKATRITATHLKILPVYRQTIDCYGSMEMEI